MKKIKGFTQNLFLWSITYKKSSETRTGIVVNSMETNTGMKFHVLRTPSDAHSGDIDLIDHIDVKGLHKNSSNFQSEQSNLKQYCLLVGL